MSGGSFNYLFEDSLSDRRGDLLAMAGELRALGFHDIARETESFIAEPSPELRKVWKAIEWWRSCDSSRVEAVETARAYDRLHPVSADAYRDGFACRCGRFFANSELAASRGVNREPQARGL